MCVCCALPEASMGTQSQVITIWWLILFVISVSAVVQVDNINGKDDPLCYSENGPPCRTLDYALINGLASSTTIMIHKGEYHLNITNASFYNMKDVAVIGAGYDVTTVECDFGTGLGFFNTNNLVLANFTLLGGGKIMNSTSINTTTDEVAVFRVALYLSDCTDVTVDGLMITNSTGTGMAMFDVTGKVEISNSVFQFNKALETETLPGGGGAFITFTLCKRGIMEPCDVTITKNVSYDIHSSTFISNVAVSSNTTKMLYLPFSSINNQFSHGGGLNFVVRGQAENNNIAIRDTLFLNNSAKWGGGLSMDLLDYSTGNQILLENLLFKANYLPYNGFVNSTGSGGGAIRISVFPSLSSNYNTTITIINSTFINNSAAFGGGIYSKLRRESNTSTVSISVTGCQFYYNVARLGSAFDAYVHPYPFGEVANLVLDTCSFIKNTNHYSDLPVKLLGHGTIYSLSVPIIFQNKNLFIGNNGGALVAISTYFVISSGGAVVFENNTATNGAAISLYESSHIVLSDNITLNFTGNVATGKGGAIYATGATQRDLIVSHYCFIVFRDPSVSPYNWKKQNVSVRFCHNDAKYGHSIFATTLYTCIWEGLPDLEEIQFSDIEQVFYWNGTFEYESLSNDTTHEISSEAAYIRNFNNGKILIPPGRLYDFNFDTENDRSENIDTVYFVTTNDSSVAVVSNDSTYSNGYTRLTGNPKTAIDIDMVTVSSLPLSIKIGIEIDDCPPGFYPFYGSSPNETVCKCSVNVPEKDYIGIVQCDTTELVAYLKPAHYAGYNDVDGKRILLTSNCLRGYCNDRDSYIQLPPNSSNEALDNIICKPQHRTGTLCGKCVEGCYIYVNSFEFECGKCELPIGWEIVIYIATKYISLILFLLIIGVWNISLVNGQLNAFVLFCQLLPYMDIYAGDRIDVSNQTVVIMYKLFYGMWNLNFLEVVMPHICVFHVQSALVMNCYDLIPVFVVVIVTGLIYCSKAKQISSRLAHCFRKCSCISKVDICKKLSSGIYSCTGYLFGRCSNIYDNAVTTHFKMFIFNSHDVEGIQWEHLYQTQDKYSHNAPDRDPEEMHGISDNVTRADTNINDEVLHIEGDNSNVVNIEESDVSYSSTTSKPSMHASFRIQALLTIVILCYARVTAFAFVLLSTSTLYGSSKDDSNDSLKVFRYDGTLKYTEHFEYTCSALATLSIVVLIPLFLLYYPFRRVFKCCHDCPCISCCSCVQMNENQDENANQKKCISKYSRTSKSVCICFDHTYDIVQQCYKSNNFLVARAAALYLLYRLIILAVYAFASSNRLLYLLQSGFFLLMLTIHSCFQPYKEKIHNVIDACIFGILAMISLLSYYRLYSEAQGYSATDKAFIIQSMLIYLPFLYFVALCLWKGCKAFSSRLQNNRPDRNSYEQLQ